MCVQLGASHIDGGRGGGHQPAAMENKIRQQLEHLTVCTWFGDSFSCHNLFRGSKFIRDLSNGIIFANFSQIPRRQIMVPTTNKTHSLKGLFQIGSTTLKFWLKQQQQQGLG